LLPDRERGVDESKTKTATGQIGPQTETDVEERFVVETGAAPARCLTARTEADETRQPLRVVVRNNATDGGEKEFRRIVLGVPVVEVVWRRIAPGGDGLDVGGGDGAKGERWGRRAACRRRIQRLSRAI